MKLKLLPAFVTLLAGAVTSISLFIFKWDFLTFLLILLGVLIIFYVIGTAAMMLIRDITEKEKLKQKQKEKEEAEAAAAAAAEAMNKEIPSEGEVIDKSEDVRE